MFRLVSAADAGADRAGFGIDDGALYLFIQKTRIGTAIRAAAIDQDAARLMGIDVNRVILLVFLLGPALGGAAGADGRAVLRPDQFHHGLGLRHESLHRRDSWGHRQHPRRDGGRLVAGRD
jgi:hypothetical protein